MDLRGPLFSKMSVLRRREQDFRNLYYQGTGSELKWERMLSRGMKRELEGGSQSKRDQKQSGAGLRPAIKIIMKAPFGKFVVLLERLWGPLGASFLKLRVLRRMAA